MALSKYSSYDVRLESLRNWLGNSRFSTTCNIAGLARAGLYYFDSDEDSESMLRCAFCEFMVANWRKDDDEWALHASFVPTCLHLLCCKGLEYVKRVLENEENSVGPLRNVASTIMYAQRLEPKDLTIYGISGLLMRKQQSASACPSSLSGVAAVYKTYRGVPFTYPKNTDMMDTQRRLDSFSSIISFGQVPNLQLLADAGFYFTGKGDSVRCYYCGEGFNNWQRTDGPWTEHARYVPDCMHVILTKGEEFVEKVQGSEYGQSEQAVPAHERDVPAHERDVLAHEVAVLTNEGPFVANGGHVPAHEGPVQDRAIAVPAHEGPRKRKLGAENDGSEDRILCEKCHRHGNVSTALCYLCCRVCVCESCDLNCGQCPVCFVCDRTQTKSNKN